MTNSMISDETLDRIATQTQADGRPVAVPVEHVRQMARELLALRALELIVRNCRLCVNCMGVSPALIIVERARQ